MSDIESEDIPFIVHIGNDDNTLSAAQDALYNDNVLFRRARGDYAPQSYRNDENSVSSNSLFSLIHEYSSRRENLIPPLRSSSLPSTQTNSGLPPAPRPYVYPSSVIPPHLREVSRSRSNPEPRVRTSRYSRTRRFFTPSSRRRTAEIPQEDSQNGSQSDDEIPNVEVHENTGYIDFAPFFQDVFDEFQRNVMNSFEQRIVQNVMEESFREYESVVKKPNHIVDVNCISYDCDKHKHTDCTICQNPFAQGDEVSILSCEHVFHNGCIVEAGMYKAECPMCRNKIPLVDDF